MRFLLVPLVVILLAMIPKSAEAQSDRFMTDDTLPWIHFSWSSGNLGGRLIEKTAMIVPLKIEELPYAFEAQFDLGACSTMIYGKAFAPYLAMASDIRSHCQIGSKCLSIDHSRASPEIKLGFKSIGQFFYLQRDNHRCFLNQSSTQVT